MPSIKNDKKDVQLHKVRHSLSHVLATAVLEKYPNAKIGIGPVIEHGFYYDFDFSSPISENELLEMEKRMRTLIQEKLSFSKKAITYPQAKKLFAKNRYKLELIEELKKKKAPISIYETTRGAGKKKETVFMDLCSGPHIKNTKEIPTESFALTHLAGAYWRGDEKNKMLTRIYGLAFENKKDLDDYREMLKEAEKRDHKKLGTELDLFTFSELVGSGLPLWTPKGTLLRELLDDFVWSLRSAYGYEKVEIPHITKKELYEKSGHWQKFSDELFRITTREGHFFAMKPMNCPHHTQIYARKKWSYRELPQRYANTTMCYRDEQSGELSGLSRVRSFAQDDAHVFCRMSQAKDEFLKIWDIVHEFYKTFGFNLRIRVSTHDPKHPEKYLGDKKKWAQAESILKEIVKGKKTDTYDGIGEAAFYGPKLDFMAKDSLGREWQVATIQLDMNMPERFDLSCVNEKGEAERIVMIHAAIMGSIERFLSVLIEHYAGAFPLWLSPVQISILPVSEKFMKYAEKIKNNLSDSGMRVSLGEANETLGKRIREAELQKIPYILVVGEKEETSKTVNIRTRGKKETETKTLEMFAREIEKQIIEKK